MKKINQTGFSIIAGLLMLVVVGILGFTGWYVYHSQKTASRTYSTTVSTGNAATTHQTDASITDGPAKGQKTYTNKTLGFSFSFPTSVWGDGICQKSTTVIDNNGNAIASPSHYVQGYTMLPTTVVSAGANYYITTKTAAILTNFKNVKVNGETYPVAKSCNASQALTGQNIGYYLENADGVHMYTEISTLPLTAIIAKQGSALNAAAGKALDDTSVKVTGLTPDKSGNWDDLTYICTSDVCVDSDSSNALRYYPAKNLLIYGLVDAGNPCELGNALNPTICYDQQITSSFELAN